MLHTCGSCSVDGSLLYLCCETPIRKLENVILTTLHQACQLGLCMQVRISRKRIMESAMKVFEMYGSSRAVLEIEYFNEVGTGLGPTLEFYTMLSHDFQRRGLKLWRGDEEKLSSTASGDICSFSWHAPKRVACVRVSMCVQNNRISGHELLGLHKIGASCL